MSDNALVAVVCLMILIGYMFRTFILWVSEAFDGQPETEEVDSKPIIDDENF